ncbi:hypothetical protein COE15_21385 [Bacillus cereus]|uniref:hypothetical protein n=1 Tax=Bacillus sp. AFS023182 TaxID=2033492 RepID=UPI000BF7E0EB|nr:hypothetical protein [Bacillus sp. AFS023182]PFD95524.1 hypothetical protein CN288_26745 [Bacillus sp. AFS023182]PGX95062.1 hypothetical protein COE15_21385 [Bacillus cereus]
MKTVYMYDKETKAYTGTKLVIPEYKTLNKLENRTRMVDIPQIVTIKVLHTFLDENKEYQEKEVDQDILQYQTVELHYQEVIPNGYTEIYNYPECYTEVPVPAYYKPVWDGEKWIETITEEELEEMNKPKPQEPSEIEKLKKKLELTEKALDDLIMGSDVYKKELAQNG